MKEFLDLCIENRISWIFGLLFENSHKWKPHHWNPQEPRTWCMPENIFYIYKFFTYVIKTHAKLSMYSRKLGNYNGTIIFEIDFMKKFSPINLKFTSDFMWILKDGSVAFQQTLALQNEHTISAQLTQQHSADSVLSWLSRLSSQLAQHSADSSGLALSWLTWISTEPIFYTQQSIGLNHSQIIH